MISISFLVIIVTLVLSSLLLSFHRKLHSFTRLILQFVNSILKQRITTNDLRNLFFLAAVSILFLMMKIFWLFVHLFVN
jgi:hypothetical protein